MPVLEFDAVQAIGERLDRFLAQRLSGVSRSRIQQWIALGAVWSEQRLLAAKTRLLGHERICVRMLPREADRAFEPDPVPLSVVYRDETLLVIDKPAGLVVHPAAGNWRGTLLNGLLHHWPQQATLPRAGIVHRLDKDTSGLLVVGATEAACTALVAQLADRSMSRRYLALVAGEPPESFTVREPIGRDPRVRTRMAVVHGASGKPALTDVRVLARGGLPSGGLSSGGLSSGQALSLVQCRLQTGRTHQIRVHLSHLGFPIQGDALYGGSMAGIARQALHAYALGLSHPASGKAVHWESPPSADMIALAQQAGIDLWAHYEALREKAGRHDGADGADSADGADGEKVH